MIASEDPEFLRKKNTVIPFTHPETQMPALVRTRGCTEQLNSVHAASLRADGGRRRGRALRLRH